VVLDAFSWQQLAESQSRADIVVILVTALVLLDVCCQVRIDEAEGGIVQLKPHCHPTFVALLVKKIQYRASRIGFDLTILPAIPVPTVSHATNLMCCVSCSCTYTINIMPTSLTRVTFLYLAPGCSDLVTAALIN